MGKQDACRRRDTEDQAPLDAVQQRQFVHPDLSLRGRSNPDPSPGSLDGDPPVLHGNREPGVPEEFHAGSLPDTVRVTDDKSVGRWGIPVAGPPLVEGFPAVGQLDDCGKPAGVPMRPGYDVMGQGAGWVGALFGAIRHQHVVSLAMLEFTGQGTAVIAGPGIHGEGLPGKFSKIPLPK